jgi:hypothetical protein
MKLNKRNHICCYVANCKYNEDGYCLSTITHINNDGTCRENEYED